MILNLAFLTEEQAKAFISIRQHIQTPPAEERQRNQHKLIKRNLFINLKDFTKITTPTDSIPYYINTFNYLQFIFNR